MTDKQQKQNNRPESDGRKMNQTKEKRQADFDDDTREVSSRPRDRQSDAEIENPPVRPRTNLPPETPLHS